MIIDLVSLGGLNRHNPVGRGRPAPPRGGAPISGVPPKIVCTFAVFVQDLVPAPVMVCGVMTRQCGNIVGGAGVGADDG